jgi:hypothetical protein
VRTVFFVAVAGISVLLWLFKYWSDTNSKDLGSMSRQWVVEHNASHQ